MLKTFNCGIGMVMCVAKERVDGVLDVLKDSGESAFVIGDIAKADGEPKVNYL